MKQQDLQPNLQTYTILIHGWTSVSHPEKALICYDEMKAAGLIPDKPLYYCIVTSLLSKAAIARETVRNGVLQVTSEMVDQGMCIDLATAKQWQRSLMNVERRPGELTRAVERIFPPGTDNHILMSCCYKTRYVITCITLCILYFWPLVHTVHMLSMYPILCRSDDSDY